MSPLLKKFDSSKCVSLVEVIQKRIEILKRKRAIIGKQARDDVAKLLNRGQDANAAARAEHVFKEENIAAVYELLEGHCKVLIKGVGVIRSEKECSSELKEAVASLIYAAPRCGDLQELSRIRELFISKYGAEYVTSILELHPGCGVNAEIVQKLSSSPPSSDVRLRILKDIALEHKIDWNYQRAIAISFESRETNDKPNVSMNQSLFSKQGGTDIASSSNHGDLKLKKPLASLSQHSELSKTEDSLVVENNTSSTGYNGNARSTGYKNAPSIVHDTLPRERGILGDMRLPFMGSTPPFEKVMTEDQNRPSQNASSGTHSSLPSAKPKFEHMKQRNVDAGKQNSNSRYKSPEIEEGLGKFKANNSSSIAHIPNKDTLPKSRGLQNIDKMASVGSGEQHHPVNPSLIIHPVDEKKADPSKMFVGFHNLSGATGLASSGQTKELASPISFYQEKYSRNPKVNAIGIHADSGGNSMVEQQDVGDRRNLMKANVFKANEETDVKNMPQIKVQSNKDVQDPVSHKENDFHVRVSADYASGVRRIQPMNREEVSDFENKHTSDRQRGIHRMLKGRDVYEMPTRGSEGQVMYQHDTLQEEQNYSTTAGSNVRRPIPSSELKPLKMDRDQELANLETTVLSATRAANVALEMVRTASMRHRAGRKGLHPEESSGTQNNYGSSQPKTGLESRRDVYNEKSQHNRMVHKNTGGTYEDQFVDRDPFQEQDSVSFDSEIPQFDESSSDSTSEDGPQLSRKSSRLPSSGSIDQTYWRVPITTGKPYETPVRGQDWNDKVRDTYIGWNSKNVTKTDLIDDDRAQSEGSSSSKNSFNSHQNSTEDARFEKSSRIKNQLYEGTDSTGLFVPIRTAQARNAGQTAGAKNSSWQHRVGVDRVRDMEIANEKLGLGVLKWHDPSEHGNDKKKWGRVDIQPFSEPYKQQGNAVDSQTNAGNYQGVRGRSVRTVRRT